MSDSPLELAKAALANNEIDYENLPDVVDDPSWNDIKDMMTLNQFLALKKQKFPAPAAVALDTSAVPPQWLSDFWKECCDPAAVDTHDNVIQLKTAAWEKSGNCKKLYIRDCYTSIIQNIADKKKTHVLLRGTPGIGKSMFMYYYIYYLAAQGGDVCIRVKFLEDESAQNWYLLRTGEDVQVTKSHTGDTDYLFSDSVDIESTRGVKTLTMLFASIKEQHYKTFFKAKQTLTGGWDIYLPLVELGEMKHMTPPGMALSDNDLLFRNVVFGGSARNCFDAGQYAAVNKELGEVVKTFLKSFFADMKCPGATDANIDWAVVVMMQHFQKLLENESSTETSQHLKRSVFTHVYVDPLTFGDAQSDYSSHCMKYLCGKLLDSQERSLQQRIQDLFGRSGEGIMFEAMAFDTMYTHLRKGGEFTMNNLKLRAKPPKSTLKKSACPLRKVLIRSVSDIEQLEAGDIGVPVTCNFPLVDYVMKPDILLQMTVASEHKGATDTLPAIRTALGGTFENHKMVFVTRAENFQQLKYNNALAEIPQFIMCPEVTANSSVLGKRKL